MMLAAASPSPLLLPLSSASPAGARAHEAVDLAVGAGLGPLWTAGGIGLVSLGGLILLAVWRGPAA
ncbi:hypothetical protein [Streptomyces sp. NPDC054863]